MSKPLSKRTLRRAAERQAQKAAHKQNQTAQPVAAEPRNSVLPDELNEADEDNEDLTLTPELLATAERLRPGFAETLLGLEEEGKRIRAALDQFENQFENQSKAETPSAANTQTTSTRTTAAQIAANQANAQHSTGPTSPEGKATVSQNRRSHGLTGKFTLLPWEDRADHNALIDSVYTEYKPDSETEYRLADSLIQHYWLMQRALHLQEQILLEPAHAADVDNKRLALFMRYQTTHERSYYKAQRELQNLQKQKKKEQIGFESQQRQSESVEAKTRLANARALTLEVDANCRQVMEAPIPGTHNIPFELITKACSEAISTLVFKQRMEDKHQAAAE